MGGIDELDSVLGRDAHQFGYCPCLLKVILHGREAIHSSDGFVIVLISDNEGEFGLFSESLCWHVALWVVYF